MPGKNMPRYPKKMVREPKMPMRKETTRKEYGRQGSR